MDAADCAEWVEWLCDHCDGSNTRKCASYTPPIKVKDEVKVELEVKKYNQLKLFDI